MRKRYLLPPLRSLKEQLCFICLGGGLGYTPVYQGRLEINHFLEGGFKVIRNFIDNANKTQMFDSKELEGLLRNSKPALDSRHSK